MNSLASWSLHAVAQRQEVSNKYLKPSNASKKKIKWGEKWSEGFRMVSRRGWCVKREWNVNAVI